MWRIMKLLTTAVLTVCVLLLAASPAPAQVTGGYSVTANTTQQGDGGSQPDGGKTYSLITQRKWSTAITDSVDTITVYWSTDRINWTAISVPNGNISGQNTPGGSFYVFWSQTSGTYFIKATMMSKDGKTVSSGVQSLYLP